MGFIPEDSGTLEGKFIAYGEPGTLGPTCLPMKAYHPADNIGQFGIRKELRIIQVEGN